jgi:hypothetical protein
VLNYRLEEQRVPVKRAIYIKLSVATATAAATVLLGAAVAPAQGADTGTTTAPAPNAGIPAAVNPATDLAAGHTPDPAPMFNESSYFTSWVKADGHDYGVLVHTILFPNIDKRLQTITVTDVTAGWHKVYDTEVAKDAYTWSTSGLNIQTPDLSWTGNERKMSVKATMPWGSLDFVLEAQGPDMKFAGTGYYPMFGYPSHEFALPSMQTTGTLSIDGTSHTVSGESWLDRQWFSVDLNDPVVHWSWTNLRLPNGDKVAVWDAIYAGGENCWATVLHPDGSYDLAAVTPLAGGADKVWVSPVSGQAYPTRWRVNIPALNTKLVINVTGTDDQEIVNALIGPRYEGTASFSGTYQGKQVTGETYVEMVGRWPAA